MKKSMLLSLVALMLGVSGIQAMAVRGGPAAPDVAEFEGYVGGRMPSALAAAAAAKAKVTQDNAALKIKGALTRFSRSKKSLANATDLAQELIVGVKALAQAIAQTGDVERYETSVKLLEESLDNIRTEVDQVINQKRAKELGGLARVLYQVSDEYDNLVTVANKYDKSAKDIQVAAEIKFQRTFVETLRDFTQNAWERATGGVVTGGAAAIRNAKAPLTPEQRQAAADALVLITLDGVRVTKDNFNKPVLTKSVRVVVPGKGRGKKTKIETKNVDLTIGEWAAYTGNTSLATKLVDIAKKNNLRIGGNIQKYANLNVNGRNKRNKDKVVAILLSKKTAQPAPKKKPARYRGKTAKGKDLVK